MGFLVMKDASCADSNYPDQPVIFRIAGFDTYKSQWFSGVNNILYMVCQPPLGFIRD